MKTQTINIVKIVLLATILSVGMAYIYAWTGPLSTPPGSNVEAPINVSNSTQIKGGGLVLGQSFTPANSALDIANGWVDVRNGGLNMHNHKIVEVSDPTDDMDAVNKRYVDGLAGGGGGIKQDSCSWIAIKTQEFAICPVGQYVAGVCTTNRFNGCTPSPSGSMDNSYAASGIYCCTP